jgi:hypothetical protein
LNFQEFFFSIKVLFLPKGNKNKEEKYIEHISCAVGLPKVVLYLFIADLGRKKSAWPRLRAPADRLPL